MRGDICEARCRLKSIIISGGRGSGCESSQSWQASSNNGQNNDRFKEEKEPASPVGQRQQQQQQIQLQFEPASVVEQPTELLYNYQQEADELDPSSSLGGQLNANYPSQLSGNSNKNNWKQPEYRGVIQPFGSTDDNVAQLSHYITQNLQQQQQQQQRQLASTSFPKLTLANQGVPSGQLSQYYLAAYLDEIHSNSRAAQQRQNNGQSLSSINSLGGSPWSSQAVRNFLTLAAGLSGGQPLVGNLAVVPPTTGYGDEQNKIRLDSMLQQKLAASGKSGLETLSRAPNSNLYNSHILLHLFALLAAILAALFAIKIFVHTSDKQRFIRRRSRGTSETGNDNKTHKPSSWFWGNYFGLPGAVAKTTGEVVEKAGNNEAGLESTSFLDRRFSSSGNSKVNSKEQEILDLESGRQLEREREREQQSAGTGAKNIDLLTQKLISLLNLKSCNGNGAEKQDIASPKDDAVTNFAASTQELDEASVGPTEILVVQNEDGKPTRFRTSRSYIKSLIEALTKAKSQVSSSVGRSRVLDEANPGGGGDDDDDDDDDDDGQQATVGLMSKNYKDGLSNNSSSTDSAVDIEQQPEAGILTSQMDISAAHLILAYMEKHLEDKERLQREWRELNENTASLDCNKENTSMATKNQQQQHQVGSKLATNAKIGQLMIQKLAKCALSEENRSKNRNCSVVPYDRNRVKLNIPTASVISKTTKSGAGSQATTPSALLGKRAKQSDYINASYIYDDDPRRPTHIIAQGPTEETLGAFWQMVWEQRVSVIVMLTRLNENSVKMCHCYWPTNNTAVNVGAAAAATAAVNLAATGSSSKMSSSNSNLNNTDNDDNNSSSSIGKKMKQQQLASSNSPLLQAGAEATASNNTNSSTNNITTNSNGARRSSVTSVFNSCEARTLNGGNNLPIIANGELNNNILCFEIISSQPLNSSSSLEDEVIGESDNDGVSHKGRDANGSRNGGTRKGNGNGNGKKTASTTNNNPSSKSKATTTTDTNTINTLTQTQEQVANQKATRFEVHLVSEHVSSSDYLVRNMYMINRSTGETRTITQFHYLAWPECGVPDNVKSFLQFRRKVHKSYRNLKSPILVHCSDGAGRSGTYTLIDTILERIKNGAKEIDPRATLEHLRDQRVGLCATQKQFEFVLVALAEEIQIILNALPH